jgi:hypothetical protein
MHIATSFARTLTSKTSAPTTVLLRAREHADHALCQIDRQRDRACRCDLFYNRFR